MTEQLDRTSDAIPINDINPFVVGADAMNLPGAWSDAQQFSYYDNDNTYKDTPPGSVEKSMSAICDVARTAGDNTISMCDPKPPNCPMSRPLIPGRDINPGMWNYNGFEKKAINFVAEQKKANDCLYLYMAVFFLFIIIFLMK